MNTHTYILSICSCIHSSSHCSKHTSSHHRYIRHTTSSLEPCLHSGVGRWKRLTAQLDWWTPLWGLVCWSLIWGRKQVLASFYSLGKRQAKRLHPHSSHQRRMQEVQKTGSWQVKWSQVIHRRKCPCIANPLWSMETPRALELFGGCAGLLGKEVVSKNPGDWAMGGCCSSEACKSASITYKRAHSSMWKIGL